MRLKALVLVLGALCGAVWGYAGWSGRLAALLPGGASPAVKEFEAGKVTIVFLDIGQGDCIFIHTPNGRNVLIDSGEGPHPDNPYSKHYDAGSDVVLPFLRDHGITRLDAIVLTHPHSDHGGGLEAVLADQNLQVGAFYDVGLRVPSKFYRNVLSLLRERHEETEYHTIFRYVGSPDAEESERPGDYLLNREMIGRDVLAGDPSCELRILGPIRIHTKGSFANNNSIVSLLRAGNLTVLLTGDAEEAELSDLTRIFGEHLKVVVLKVPHHGSKATSLHAGFVEAASPRYTVYQVGADNTFGHPHKQNFAFYQEHVEPDPEILRNDLHGDIVLTTDGRTYAFATEKHPDPAEVRIGREFQRRGRRGRDGGGGG